MLQGFHFQTVLISFSLWRLHITVVNYRNWPRVKPKIRIPLKCITAANYFTGGENGIISGGVGSSHHPWWWFPLVLQAACLKWSPFLELSSLCTAVSAAPLVKILTTLLVSLRLFFSFSLSHILSCSLSHCLYFLISLSPMLSHGFSVFLISCSLMSIHSSLSLSLFLSSISIPPPPLRETFKTFLHPLLEKERIKQKSQVPIHPWPLVPATLLHLHFLRLPLHSGCRSWKNQQLCLHPTCPLLPEFLVFLYHLEHHLFQKTFLTSA